MDNSIKKVNIKQKNSILKKITSTKINLIISIMLTILLLTICIIAPLNHMLIRQIKKLGNTPYELEDLKIKGKLSNSI